MGFAAGPAKRPDPPLYPSYVRGTAHALAYAQADLADYQTFGTRAAADLQQTERLIAAKRLKPHRRPRREARSHLKRRAGLIASATTRNSANPAEKRFSILNRAGNPFIMITDEFEWDDEKAARNWRNHKISSNRRATRLTILSSSNGSMARKRTASCAFARWGWSTIVCCALLTR